MTSRDLELTPERFELLVNSAKERITDWLESLPRLPVNTASDASNEAIRSLAEALPKSPTPLDELLDILFDEAAAAGLNPTSPGFMGYVPGGGILHAAVADLIANSINQYVAVSAVAPVLNQVETNVVRWLCAIVGYPEKSRGFLTSGGSMATLSAMITARHVRLGEEFLDGVVYVSDQVHHCVTKAARLAGFPDRNVRVLPSDAGYRMDLDSLAKSVRDDRRRGMRPFMVVASGGTVNCGVVDPLVELARLSREEGLWFHVDAAYGGLFCLTDRGRTALRGIDDADSIVVDPHKTLFLPYGTGCLLVRSGDALRHTHSSSADYLPDLQAEESGAWDFCEISPELTRPFRGLRIWLPMKLYGAHVFRDYLDEKLDLAAWIENRIRQMPALELVAPADLSILAFSVAGRGLPTAERNNKTKRLLTLINRKNRVHLTGTMLRQIFVIRIAIVSFRTHQDRLEMLITDLEESLQDLA